jgi:hypothetical protein
VQLVPGEQYTTGRMFYPEDPPVRPVHLHHLHGCLTHLRNPGGRVIKISARGGAHPEHLRISRDGSRLSLGTIGDSRIKEG